MLKYLIKNYDGYSIPYSTVLIETYGGILYFAFRFGHELKKKTFLLIFSRSTFRAIFILRIYGFYWTKVDAHNKLHHITTFVRFSVMSDSCYVQSHTVQCPYHIWPYCASVYILILHYICPLNGLKQPYLFLHGTI